MDNATLELDAPSADVAPYAEPIRVLTVDDNSVYGSMLGRWIGSQPDMQVVGLATNGRQALGMADALHPDAVVMDVFMPTMNGLDATAELSVAHPDMPVIGMTAHCSDAVRQLCAEAGMCAFLCQTDVDRDLLRTIRTVCGRSDRDRI
jgi:DNA-binding NarL/FixJ family response regulator